MTLPFRLFFAVIFAFVIVGTGFAIKVHLSRVGQAEAWCALNGYRSFTVSHLTLCEDATTHQIYRPDISK